MKQRHAALVTATCDLLRTQGWWVLPIRTHGIKTDRGFIPAIRKGVWDVLATKHVDVYIGTLKHASYSLNRVLWVEAKVGKDVLSEPQEEFRREVEHHCMETFVVRDTVDELVKRLKP